MPALLFALSTVVLSWGEYYAFTYLIVSAVFCTLSFLLGTNIPARVRLGQGDRIKLLVFRSTALAWIASLLLLAILNVTPLCVGQNNGDGRNTIGMCCSYTVVASAAYSVLVVGLASFTAVAAASFLARLIER
jgi:hypothetical protein